MVYVLFYSLFKKTHLRYLGYLQHNKTYMVRTNKNSKLKWYKDSHKLYCLSFVPKNYSLGRFFEYTYLPWKSVIRLLLKRSFIDIDIYLSYFFASIDKESDSKEII